MPPVEDVNDCDTVIGVATALVRGLVVLVTDKVGATPLDMAVPGEALVVLE